MTGTASRDLLARITRDDVSAEAFKFRDLRQTFVGGVPVILNRISFSGELGYEIYCKPQYLLRLAEAIEDAGADLGYRWYGARALMSRLPRLPRYRYSLMNTFEPVGRTWTNRPCPSASL